MSTVTAARPTNMKPILLSVAGALILGFFFLKGFWLPYQDNKKKIAAAEEDYDKEFRDYVLFQKEKGRLERDKLLGLPRGDINQASNDYVRYLQGLLAKCGFDRNPEVSAAGVSIGPSVNTGKKAGHTSVTFVARAQGTWTSMVKFLEQFQRTGFIHRLRNWTVDAPVAAKEKAGKLVVNMTIEALIVNRNERRPDNLWGVDPRLLAVDAVLGLHRLPTGWATLIRAQGLLVPDVPKRVYGELVRVNPFVGGPLEAIKSVDPLADAKNLAEQRKKLRAPAKLVQTDTDGQKALLISRTSENKSVAINLSNKSTFEIWEGKKGKVLRVDHYDLYFEAEGKVHCLHIGHTLEEAMKKPLSDVEWRQVNAKSI